MVARIFAVFSHATTNRNDAIAYAQSMSDEQDSPVGVWERDGWHGWTDLEPEAVEELAPDWQLVAVVDPIHDGRRSA
jgi:hypothetical protein